MPTRDKSNYKKILHLPKLNIKKWIFPKTIWIVLQCIYNVCLEFAKIRNCNLIANINLIPSPKFQTRMQIEIRDVSKMTKLREK